jgi:ketosteroid isomerase-like protein
VSEENVAIVRAIFEGDSSLDKEAILAALPEVIPALFHPDAEWVEAPERVDSRTYRGHDGIRESFENWLEHWDDYRMMAERFEDHGDHVLVRRPRIG